MTQEEKIKRVSSRNPTGPYVEIIPNTGRYPLDELRKTVTD
jgi:hypothetical protein